MIEMVESFWKELKDKLKERGLSEEEITDLEDHIRRDNLFSQVEGVLGEIRLLDDLIKALSDVKEIEGHLYEHRHQVEYLKDLLSEEIVRYWKETRSSKKKLFGGKSPAKRLSKIIRDMTKELEESRYRLLSNLKGLIRRELDKSSGGISGKLIKEIESMESIKDAAQVEKLLENFPSLLKRRKSTLKRRDLRKLFAERNVTKELGPYEVTENTLDDLLLHMEIIERHRRKLNFLGLRYIRLEEFSAIEEDLAYIFVKYRGKETYLKLSAPFRYMEELKREGELLNQLANKLISLDIKIERTKEDISSELSDKGMGEYSEVIKLIGASNLKPPLTLYYSDDVEMVEEAVEKMQRLSALLDDLKEELSKLPENLKVSLIDVPSDSEEDFIRGFINALRISRLSRGLPTPVYSFSEIVDTVLKLYPQWREQVLRSLLEKGSMTISELNFIPKTWRDWFLNTLEDEGMVSISGDKLLLKLPSYDLLEKTRAKLEILRDTLSDLGTSAGKDFTEEMLQSYLKEFEKAKDLISKGKVKEATIILERLDSNLNKLLYGEKSKEEKELHV